MLLIGMAHDQIRKGLAQRVAYQPIALINRLTCCSTVTRHRHPTSIDNDPAFVSLMAHNSGKYADRNIVECAYAKASHHKIEKSKYARTNFRHAGQVPGKESRRR